MNDTHYSFGSLRLFKKRPSFIEGIATIIDLSAIEDKYNSDQTAKEADFKSLQADWSVIGGDMKRAIKIYESAGSN